MDGFILLLLGMLLIPAMIVGGLAHLTRRSRSRESARVRLLVLMVGVVVALILGYLWTRGVPEGCTPDDCMIPVDLFVWIVTGSVAVVLFLYALHAAFAAFDLTEDGPPPVPGIGDDGAEPPDRPVM